jgi:hypothetical protein
MIEELIDRAATRTGLSQDQARTALSAALHLIQKHGEPAKVGELMQAIPGSQGLADQGSGLAEGKSGGLLGGLMRNVGGGGGAAMSDAMAMGQKLSKQGVTVSDMQKILPIAMEWVKEKTGRDLLRNVLSSIPGLGPLMVSQA